MVILDIETTGIDPVKNSMVSIGAVDFNSDASFYLECRAYSNREVSAVALDINGFSLEQIYDSSKMMPHEAYLEFVKWCKSLYPQQKTILLGGHNIGSFDVLFLKQLHDSYSKINYNFTDWIFGHRYVDLHSVAYGHFEESMKMDEILQKLGFDKEQKPHNALVGAKCEKAAFEKMFRLCQR